MLRYGRAGRRRGIVASPANLGGPPTRPGPTIGDAGTGVQMALAITAAYAQKLREGVGQHIELSMQEAVTYYMRTMIALGARAAATSRRAWATNSSRPSTCMPANPSALTDYVYLMSVMENHWAQLCKTMGQPDLATDPRYADVAARKQNSASLKPVIAAWMAARTKHEAMHELCEAGIPASAVFDTRDLFSDPHLAAPQLHPPRSATPTARTRLRCSAGRRVCRRARSRSSSRRRSARTRTKC